MTQIKKNLIYNVLYQILILILPIITVPYVSRIIGTEGVGIYSYTYSIVYYFMMLCLLGINNYGNRTIAKTKENKYELSKNFISIYIIQFTMSIIMIILYIIYLIFFVEEYKIIAIIQIIYILSSMFDINWFYFGLEKFKLTVTRNSLIKIVSIILIFLFVKDKNDLWIYTLILSLTTLLSQLLLFVFLKKEIIFIKVNKKEIAKHIKPALILFVPVIAISLYKIMDKIMLGYLINVVEVGYYEQAEKIINIPLGLITALGTVMLPRISSLISKGNDKIIKEYIKNSLKFMMFISFPIVFGLITISSNFIPMFLGYAFVKSSIILKYLSVTIIFLSIANVIRTQYLIPKEKDSIYIKSVILGAIINFIINLLLIPRYHSIGASIGTIFAEFSVMFYQLIKIKKEISIFKIIKENLSFLIKSVIMFIIIYPFNYLKIEPIYIVILQIINGCIIYFVLNFKYIDNLINIKKIIKKLFKRKK